MPWLWGYAASSASSVLFGVLSFLIFRRTGRHRDGNNRIIQGKITVCILQSISFYTLAICLLGQWALKIPLSQTIHEGFGDERAAWLLLGTAIDVLIRLYGLMDPDEPSTPGSLNPASHDNLARETRR